MYTEINFYSSNAYDPTNPLFPVRSAPYVDRFKILRCSIPLAFETTDSTNNVVTFMRDGQTLRAVLPAANYTSATFPQALQDAMNAVVSVKDFAVSYSQDTKRLTIGSGSTFTVLPFSQGTTAYGQLGMNKFDAAKSGTSVSFGVSDFTNYAPLLLTSSSLVSKSIVFANEENINILAMIETNSPQNSVVSWTNTNGGYLNCGANLTQIDFRILNGRTLLPVTLSQPYSVSIGILTDADDIA